MKDNNQEIIEKIIKTAKHWAKTSRKILPKSMHNIFDTVENEYFHEFEVCCMAHQQLFTGKVSKHLREAEAIIRNSIKRSYKKNPAHLIVRNLVIAFLETFSELNRHAINQVCKTVLSTENTENTEQELLATSD